MALYILWNQQTWSIEARMSRKGEELVLFQQEANMHTALNSSGWLLNHKYTLETRSPDLSCVFWSIVNLYFWGRMFVEGQITVVFWRREFCGEVQEQGEGENCKLTRFLWLYLC